MEIVRGPVCKIESQAASEESRYLLKRIKWLTNCPELAKTLSSLAREKQQAWLRKVDVVEKGVGSLTRTYPPHFAESLLKGLKDAFREDSAFVDGGECCWPNSGGGVLRIR